MTELTINELKLARDAFNDKIKELENGAKPNKPKKWKHDIQEHSVLIVNDISPDNEVFMFLLCKRWREYWLAREDMEWKPNWNNYEEMKYYPLYENEDKEWRVGSVRWSRCIGQIYMPEHCANELAQMLNEGRIEGVE